MLLSAEDLAEHQHGEHKGKDLTKKADLLVNMKKTEEITEQQQILTKVVTKCTSLVIWELINLKKII